jgi:hypothetical protein
VCGPTGRQQIASTAAAAASAAAERGTFPTSSSCSSSQGFFDRLWWSRLWGPQQQQQIGAAAVAAEGRARGAEQTRGYWFNLDALLLLGEGSTGDAGAVLRGAVNELADLRVWNRC